MMISDVSSDQDTMPEHCCSKGKRDGWMCFGRTFFFLPSMSLSYSNFYHHQDHEMQPCTINGRMSISIKDQFNQIQVSKHHQVVNCSLFKYDELISEKLT